MRTQDVLEFAPRIAALGLWPMVVGMYAPGPASIALIALSAVITSACLGVLLAHYPHEP